MHFENAIQAILVITAGHVMVGRVEGGNDGHYRLYDARIIRQWGTKKGLNELYDGPLSGTVLDAVAPLVLVPAAHVIYVLPVQENPAWTS